MTMTLTHVAAVVAGLALIASQFAIARNSLFRSLAAAVGLAIVAAGLIHAIAS